jgi:hypothetical protein
MDICRRPKHVDDLRRNKFSVNVKSYQVGYVIVIV